MTPDEVRMLDNRYALLFIRGERPVLDEKYDILRHPNVGETADGGQSVYLHGQVTRAVASVSIEQGFSLSQKQQPVEITTEQPAFDLLSEEDLENLLKNEEKKSYEKEQ